ncbi:hypothetical protein CVIRNUC_003415 [Coccomyxa viridis]|uniref:Uncharacterized protein n=1 Tax=Coccomyxa viridis TaxID=1274662 RepID=A0AAV1I1M4_9CHLO|nr:hypothetical protein CVIRNUC_003415 [Coccomyxa viridis]
MAHAHREFDRIVKQYGKTAQIISEDERQEIRQHEIKMKEIDRDIEMRAIDRDIEVAREANRSKELDIELRKLQMGIHPAAQLPASTGSG